MCIGFPMEVVSIESGHAMCEGRGRRRRVDIALIGDCRPGDWLLVFLDCARERLDRVRAVEINATLDLLANAMSGHRADADPGFALPSSLDSAQIASLTGVDSLLSERLTS